MIFKQLFEKNSCTYSYLIADENSREAVFIDPINSDVDDYLALLRALDLRLIYSFETHVHADHISGSGLLRQATEAQTCIGIHCGAESANNQLKGGEVFAVGDHTITTLATPGHTLGSMSFLCGDKIFTGDSLLIGGCGRTDFQSGNAGDLYDSITQQIFTLPDETLIYPAHDYKGDFVSCVRQEKNKNTRLAHKTREQFMTIMANLNLPKPQLIDVAVPVNRYCGIDEALENQDATQKITTIQPAQAKALLKRGEAFLIDVREAHEFNNGHIKNAVLMPRGQLANKIMEQPNLADKSVAIIVYCGTGKRAARATATLMDMGYTQVMSIAGGYQAWK